MSWECKPDEALCDRCAEYGSLLPGCPACAILRDAEPEAEVTA